MQLDPNDTVKVAARIRPLLDHEREQGIEETIEMSLDDPSELQVRALRCIMLLTDVQCQSGRLVMPADPPQLPVQINISAESDPIQIPFAKRILIASRLFIFAGLHEPFLYHRSLETAFFTLVALLGNQQPYSLHCSILYFRKPVFGAPHPSRFLYI